MLPLGTLGTRDLISDLASLVVMSVIVSLSFLVAFSLSKKIFRRDWAVVAIVTLTLFLLLLVSVGAPVLSLVPVAVLLLLVLPTRLGLLASAVGLFVTLQTVRSPITYNTSAWYFVTGLATFLVVAGLSLAAFRISLGDRRLLDASGAED